MPLPPVRTSIKCLLSINKTTNRHDNAHIDVHGAQRMKLLSVLNSCMDFSGPGPATSVPQRAACALSVRLESTWNTHSQGQGQTLFFVKGAVVRPHWQTEEWRSNVSGTGGRVRTEVRRVCPGLLHLRVADMLMLILVCEVYNIILVLLNRNSTGNFFTQCRNLYFLTVLCNTYTPGFTDNA